VCVCVCVCGGGGDERRVSIHGYMRQLVNDIGYKSGRKERLVLENK
jgi:hypothetical protein